ncbi:hypothetical protein BC629DRAFT_1595424 [Irpex lacteus]|nr:hypothetical protein BC629DRAFT_1595424 [Irpex lacteus]
MFTWNTTIEDTSSMLDFHPYSEGTTSGGWASFFQDLGFFHGSPGLDSQSKDSVHITKLKGASVTLKFEELLVFCHTRQPACDDSFPIFLPEGTLFYQENLTSTTHSISLIANPDAGQQLAFDKAVVTNIGINAGATSAVQIDNQASKQTALHYNGNWTSQSAYNVPSDALPAPFMSTSNPGDTSLDGVVTVHNASTWWLMGDALLFYQSNLDPEATHTIQLANMGTPNDKLSLNYFTVYTPNGTALDTSLRLAPHQALRSLSPPRSLETNVGVIVGPVIAGVALFVALLGLFLWLRHRRQQQPSSSSDAPLIPPETSQSTTTLGGIVAPFPRNERPDLWVKGMEAGQPAPSIMEIQAVPPVVPYEGKRRRANAPATQPEPETTANTHTLSPSASSASLRQPSLRTANASSPLQPDSSSQRSVPLTSSSDAHHRGNTSISMSSTARTASPMPQVNVDQIIELIAQRIDHNNRGPFMASGAVDESDVPPPEYYAS